MFLKYLIYLAFLLISAGVISTSAKKLCKEACTREFRPQCAILTDGSKSEFANKCLLDLETCKGNIAVKSVVQGRCYQPNEKPKKNVLKT